MNWWWLLISIGIGTVSGAFAGAFVGFVIALGRESTERRRRSIDLADAKPLDPDDWFLDPPVPRKEWAGAVVKPSAHLRPADAPPSPAVPPKP